MFQQCSTIGCNVSFRSFSKTKRLSFFDLVRRYYSTCLYISLNLVCPALDKAYRIQSPLEASQRLLRSRSSHTLLPLTLQKVRKILFYFEISQLKAPFKWLRKMVVEPHPYYMPIKKGKTANFTCSDLRLESQS